jgi:hypothetical protein
MAIDDFANCYATRVETTVDAIIDEMRRLGEDNIRRLVDWWANANDSSKDLVKLLAGAATAVLAVILGKLLTNGGNDHRGLSRGCFLDPARDGVPRMRRTVVIELERRGPGACVRHD